MKLWERDENKYIKFEIPQYLHHTYDKVCPESIHPCIMKNRDIY